MSDRRQLNSGGYRGWDDKILETLAGLSRKLLCDWICLADNIVAKHASSEDGNEPSGG